MKAQEDTPSLIRNDLNYPHLVLKFTPQLLIAISLCLLSVLPAKANLTALSHAFAIECGAGEKPSVELSFGQPWLENEQKNFRAGHVALYPHRNGLAIIASLSDEEIYSDATAMNQAMWRLGDAFEIFIGIPGQPEYWELHVTPNNHRLQLLWTEQALTSFHKKASVLSNHTISDADFLASATRINHTEGYWQVYVFLPWVSIGLSDGCDSYSLELAFCRYDSEKSKQAPLLSSTAQLNEKNFHLRQQWSKVTFNLGGK